MTTRSGPELPLSAVVAWWLTAWLRGDVSADDTLDRLGHGHAVAAHLPGGPGSGADLLAHLRASGAADAGLALPVDGDLLGLGGPPAFNHAALDAGEAIVCGPWGLVPSEHDGMTHWHVLPADRRQVPDLHDAQRTLRLAVIDAAEGLAALDVARWRPEVADVLMDLHHVPAVDSPAGTPPACVELAGRASVADLVVALALEDDGSAVSATEMERRTALLAPVAAAARRALVAACSPEVWPPRPDGVAAH